MSFKVDHKYTGIVARPETFLFPSALQGLLSKSSQWEPVVINLTDEIDADTAIQVAQQLRKAEDTGQTFVPFYIESPGGSVYGLLSIVEAMRRCKVPIYTFTSGIAASCAACVFCMGQRRFMTRHARLLLHDVSVDFSSETSMTTTNIKAEAKEMRRLNRTILQLIAENTGHPINYFADLIKTKRNNDIYVTADEALAWQMATDIGFPVVKVKHATTMSLSVLRDTSARRAEDDTDDDDDSDTDKTSASDDDNDSDTDKTSDDGKTIPDVGRKAPILPHEPHPSKKAAEPHPSKKAAEHRLLPNATEPHPSKKATEPRPLPNTSDDHPSRIAKPKKKRPRTEQKEK